MKKIISVATFSLLILVISYFGITDKRQDYRTYILGNSVFDVPLNYSYRAAHFGTKSVSSKPINTSQFNLDAMLPNIDPLDDQNIVDYEKAGWGRELMISVSINLTKTNEDLIRYYDSDRYAKEIKPIFNGFKAYEYLNSHTGEVQSSIYIDETSNSKIDYISCENKSAVISPSCKIIMNDEKKSISISFAVSSEQINSLEVIGERIIKKIEEFRRR